MECSTVVTNSSGGNKLSEVCQGGMGGNENVYKTFGKGITTDGMDCAVLEWVKCSTYMVLICNEDDFVECV